MAYIPDVISADLGKYAYDAFGRQRVSNTGNRLDVEFLYDKQEDYFDEITNGATASVTHNVNSRDLTLTVGSTTNGEYATMRSHPVPYTPGSSQLVDITGVLDLAAIGSGTAEVFLRSNVTGSVVETTVTQANWDNATSGVDWTDSHILSMDFQSLKVGTIRYWLVRSGVPVFLTAINNDNVRNTGYWQLASLQAYWRIYNDATNSYMEMAYGDESNAIGIRYVITANSSASMKAICCTVKSEGGPPLSEMPGLPRSCNTDVLERTVSATAVPIISVRAQSTFSGLPSLILAIPKSFSVSTDNPIRVDIIQDGALTGASFSSVTSSCLEYDKVATAITGGKVIYSEYFSTAKNTDNSGKGLLGKSVLWRRQGSQSGIFSIVAIKTGATDGAALASINWEEIR